MTVDMVGLLDLPDELLLQVGEQTVLSELDEDYEERSVTKLRHCNEESLRALALCCHRLNRLYTPSLLQTLNIDLNHPEPSTVKEQLASLGNRLPSASIRNLSLWHDGPVLLTSCRTLLALICSSEVTSSLRKVQLTNVDLRQFADMAGSILASKSIRHLSITINDTCDLPVMSSGIDGLGSLLSQLPCITRVTLCGVVPDYREDDDDNDVFPSVPTVLSASELGSVGIRHLDLFSCHFLGFEYELCAALHGLSISFEQVFSVLHVLEGGQYSLAQLRTLEIASHFAGHEYGNFTSSIDQLLRACPNLQQVHLPLCRAPLNLFASLPKSLISLDITHVARECFLDFLYIRPFLWHERLPRLRSFTLRIDWTGFRAAIKEWNDKTPESHQLMSTAAKYRVALRLADSVTEEIELRSKILQASRTYAEELHDFVHRVRTDICYILDKYHVNHAITPYHQSSLPPPVARKIKQKQL